MLFNDDIILIDETRDEVNNKLEQCKDILKAKGFRLNRLKTKYLKCLFSQGESGIEDDVTIGSLTISRVKKFRYLGSIIHQKRRRFMRTLTIG